jgi:hypothetical protein
VEGGWLFNGLKKSSFMSIPSLQPAYTTSAYTCCRRAAKLKMLCILWRMALCGAEDRRQLRNRRRRHIIPIRGLAQANSRHGLSGKPSPVGFSPVARHPLAIWKSVCRIAKHNDW